MSYEIGIGGAPEEVYHISVSASRPSLIDKPPGQSGTGETSKEIYKPQSTLDGIKYLKKINSNVKHLPLKMKLKQPTAVTESYGKKYYRYYYEPESILYYAYFVEQFQGLEYNLDSYENLDAFMPFRQKNPTLTDSSQNYIKSASALFNDTAYLLDSWKYKYGDGDVKSLGYTSYSGYSEMRSELQQNLQEFILSQARSALKAGVPCQTILNDIKENMSITGLDDETFLNACREEKGIELGRMHHENTEESICCIDVEMQPNKYRSEGESFDSYFGRLKNTFYWGNLSLTYEFL